MAKLLTQYCISLIVVVIINPVVVNFHYNKARSQVVSHHLMTLKLHIVETSRSLLYNAMYNVHVVFIAEHKAAAF